MRKKILFALLLAIACATLFSACTGAQDDRADAAPPEAGSAETEPAETPEANENGGQYEYPAEDAGSVVQESRLGYSMTYDPTVFTLDDTGDGDTFIYNTAEALEAPVYISVLAYPDMDAEALAEGLALQSGVDGVTPQITYFGAESMETNCVYVEREASGVVQTQALYAVPMEEGALLVEISGYVGMPENAGRKLEEMLSTFSLL